jgi:uncharacterized damage-inducible protein DinB
VSSMREGLNHVYTVLYIYRTLTRSESKSKVTPHAESNEKPQKPPMKLSNSHGLPN